MISSVRRLGLSLLLTTIVIASCPGLVFAHDLQQDHGVSAVLHVEPDDNPVAATPVYIGLDFANPVHGFDISSCSCILTTRTSSGQLLSAPVVRNGSSSVLGHVTLNFPYGGIYDVVVSGRAGHGEQQEFHLPYRIKVFDAAASAEARSAIKPLVVAALSLVSLLLLSVIALRRIRRGGRYS